VSGIADGRFFTFTDYCKDDTLAEFYCQNNDVKNLTFECENGCTDGRCMLCTPLEQRCAGNVLERCNVFGTGWSHHRNCPRDCEDGECVEFRSSSSDLVTLPIEPDIWPVLPTCYDSDGQDFYNKGYVEHSVYRFGNYLQVRKYDYCQGDFLNEQVCAMGMPSFIRHRCDYGCRDGACSEQASFWGTYWDNGFSLEHGGINPNQKNEVYIQRRDSAHPSKYEDKCV